MDRGRREDHLVPVQSRVDLRVRGVERHRDEVTKLRVGRVRVPQPASRKGEVAGAADRGGEAAGLGQRGGVDLVDRVRAAAGDVERGAREHHAARARLSADRRVGRAVGVHHRDRRVGGLAGHEDVAVGRVDHHVAVSGQRKHRARRGRAAPDQSKGKHSGADRGGTKSHGDLREVRDRPSPHGRCPRQVPPRHAGGSPKTRPTRPSARAGRRDPPSPSDPPSRRTPPGCGTPLRGRSPRGREPIPHV